MHCKAKEAAAAAARWNLWNAHRLYKVTVTLNRVGQHIQQPHRASVGLTDRNRAGPARLNVRWEQPTGRDEESSEKRREQREGVWMWSAGAPECLLSRGWVNRHSSCDSFLHDRRPVQTNSNTSAENIPETAVQSVHSHINNLTVL